MLRLDTSGDGKLAAEIPPHQQDRQNVNSGIVGFVSVAEPADLAGLLRTWRTQVAAIPASRVAASLGVGRSTLANWESGLRTPGAGMLEALDAAYQAKGALVDLAWALASPQSLDPRVEWWHNYQPAGGPVWAWARPEHAGPVRLELRWGPLAMRVERRLGPQGVIVRVAASVANPPVHARIEPPGWVDFGQGPIPSALPIPTINALAHVRLANPADDALAIISSRLRAALDGDGDWIDKLAGFLAKRRDLVTDGLSRTTPGPRLADLTGRAPERPDTTAHAWSGPRYRALREARGLSRTDAATRARALDPATPVSDEQIALLEGGGRPRVADLPARLDVVYRADGHSVRQPIPVVTATDGTTTITVPPWWTGPIWLTPHTTPATARSQPGLITLRWPPWQHRLRLHPATTLTTRKSPGQDKPLHALLPTGWTLTAGLGVHPDAIDINHGWHATDTTSADQILNHYHRVYLQLFNRTHIDLIRLLQRQAPGQRTPPAI